LENSMLCKAQHNFFQISKVLTMSKSFFFFFEIVFLTQIKVVLQKKDRISRFVNKNFCGSAAIATFEKEGVENQVSSLIFCMQIGQDKSEHNILFKSLISALL